MHQLHRVWYADPLGEGIAMIHALLVRATSDNDPCGKRIQDSLNSLGYQCAVTVVSSVPALRKALDENIYDVCLVPVPHAGAGQIIPFDGIMRLFELHPFGEYTMRIALAEGMEGLDDAVYQLITPYGHHIRDIATLKMPLHLAHVVAREANVSRILRHHASLRAEMDRRFVAPVKALGESSTDFKLAHSSHRDIVEDIHNAIRNKDLLYVYQPIIGINDLSAAGMRADCFEIYIRLKGRVGVINPLDFIPIAEHYGLMPAIDRLVIDHATSVLREESGKGRHLTLFVNLSEASLMDPVLSGAIAARIASPGERGGRIVIELSKHAALNNLDRVRDFQWRTSGLELQYAFEHFNGDDNISDYLKRLKIDYVKIHGDFIAGLASGHARHVQKWDDALESMIGRVKTHGARTIAHGVESAATIPALYRYGVDFIQGHFVSPPLQGRCFDLDFGLEMAV